MPLCQGRNDRRNEWQGRAMVVDEDVKSSHSKDAKRGEVIANRRVLLSGGNEIDQMRSLFRTR